jgi:hypothetical protein
MIDKDTYLAEVEIRLQRMFSARKSGVKASSMERHRLEGFVQAGVYMGFATNDEMNELMEKVHQSVFGQSISERRTTKSVLWSGEAIDYSQYDLPTIKRIK